MWLLVAYVVGAAGLRQPELMRADVDPDAMPRYGSPDDWLAHHPPVGTGAPRQVALCLYGVMGVAYGKARSADTSTEAMLETASTHLDHIIKVAEHSNIGVHVFSHGWVADLDPRSTQAAVESSYAPWLKRHLQHPVGSMSNDSIRSHAITMKLSLELAHNYSLANGVDYDLVLLMRHDTFWFADLDLMVDAHSITTATWCQRSITAFEFPCVPLRYTEFRGVHDYWFLGNMTIMRQMFNFYAMCTDKQEAACLNRRAHFTIQQAAERIRLPQRGLFRSHPSAISYVHFTLYRWKEIVPVFQSNQTPVQCDGRPVCIPSKDGLAIGDPGPFYSARGMDDS